MNSYYKAGRQEILDDAQAVCRMLKLDYPAEDDPRHRAVHEAADKAIAAINEVFKAMNTADYYPKTS